MEDKKINSKKLKELGDKLFDEVLKVLTKHRGIIKKELNLKSEEIKGPEEPLIKFGVEKDIGFGVVLWKSSGSQQKRVENFILEDCLSAIKLFSRLLKNTMAAYFRQAPNHEQALKEIANALGEMSIEVVEKEPPKC